jgi:hypothetical protein
VYVLDHAGNASLMTQALRNTLRDRATRNYRTLTDIAAEMPTATALKIVPLRDEKQYFDVFAPPPSEGDPAPFALVQTPAPLMKISPANQLTTRTSLRYMFAGMHTSAKNSTLQGQVQP